MQFQPSNLSYGDGTVTITPIDQPAASEADPVSSGGGGLPAGIEGYVDLGVGAVKSLLGLDEGARESVATLEAQLDIAQKKKANNALPGAWYWDDRVIKLSGQLEAARALAAEEKRAADIATARDIGYTVAVFAGVVLMGGFAVNQIQKARRQQAEIRKLSKS